MGERKIEKIICLCKFEEDIKNIPDMGKLYAAHVIHDLYRYTDGKALVVSDVGQHQMWEAQ